MATGVHIHIRVVNTQPPRLSGDTEQMLADMRSYDPRAVAYTIHLSKETIHAQIVSSIEKSIKERWSHCRGLAAPQAVRRPANLLPDWLRP